MENDLKEEMRKHEIRARAMRGERTKNVKRERALTV